MYVNTLVMCPFLCAVLCDVNKCLSLSLSIQTKSYSIELIQFYLNKIDHGSSINRNASKISNVSNTTGFYFGEASKNSINCDPMFLSSFPCEHFDRLFQKRFPLSSTSSLAMTQG